MLACKSGHTHAVEVLLSEGADISKKNHQHQTALDLAISRNFLDIVSQLRRAEETNRLRNQVTLSSSHRKSNSVENITLAPSSKAHPESYQGNLNLAASTSPVLEQEAEISYSIDRAPNPEISV